MRKRRQRWAVIMAGGGRIDSLQARCTWRAEEQFSDIVLVEDQTRQLTSGEGLRTTLLVDGSSGGDSRGVAAGIVLALGQIRRSDRDAVIGFFPSLEHAAHLAHFDSALQRAYDAASEHPRRLVVAGSLPDGHDYEREALVINAFGRFPHVSAAHAVPGQRNWRPVSVTVGTVDAFRAGLLAVDVSLAALVDAIASSSSIRGEARALREAAERTASLKIPPFGATRLRQACWLVPLMEGRQRVAKVATS